MSHRYGARRTAHFVLCALAGCLALGSTEPASAKIKEQAGQLYSIEKRNLLGSHELSVMLGTLPLDAFGTGLTIQGSYTYHFSQMIAWEIVGGTYSFALSTKLKDDLRERFDVQPEGEQAGTLNAMIHSNFVFKPLYGKLALLNDTLLAAEMFLVAGPALGFFDDQSVPFGLDVGVGFRFFLGRYFSIRVDIRDYIFLPEFQSVENSLYLSVGLSLTFGFSDETDEEE